MPGAAWLQHGCMMAASAELVCCLLLLWNRPEPDAPRGGSCLNGLSIICQIQLSNSCQTFVIATVPHPRLGRVEVPLTQDALPTRRGVMTPPALRHRAVPPFVVAAEA